MSRSDDGSLGWEVWFLLASVGGGGAAAILVILDVILGVSNPEGGGGTAPQVESAVLVADRVVIGCSVAAVFVALALLAARSIRRLDRSASG